MWTQRWPCLEQVLDTSYSLPWGHRELSVWGYTSSVYGLVMASTYSMSCFVPSFSELSFFVSYAIFSHLLIFVVFQCFLPMTLPTPSSTSFTHESVNSVPPVLPVILPAPYHHFGSSLPVPVTWCVLSFYETIIPYTWNDLLTLLKMKEAGFFQTLVTNYPSTQCHISKDINCHQIIISYT